MCIKIEVCIFYDESTVQTRLLQGLSVPLTPTFAVYAKISLV